MTFALALAGVASFAPCMAVTSPSPATTPVPAPGPSVADSRYPAFERCSVLSVDEASQLLGYDVLPPDATARAAGRCFFASQSISEEGSVFYALVTAARLVTLRPYFIALARRCAGVVPSSPRAAACAMYRKLAAVRDVDAYYAARTTLPGASAVTELGDGTGAMDADGTLFVRQGTSIVEAAIRRDGAFDLERSEALARVLLQRLLARPPRPSPSGV